MKNPTILKSVASGAVAMSLLATSAIAGPPAPTYVPPAPEGFYNAGEFGISVAALLTANSNTSIFNRDFRDDVNWGVSAEGSYFITRNFGIGIEGQYVDVGRPFWASNLNLYLRAPLNESSRWAPYLLGGLGGVYQSDNAQFQGFIGAGIEYRFTPQIGTFIDGRHNWVNDQDVVPNYGSFRAGFKFVF